jgi:multidrug efflux pump subunit AcrB
MGAAPDNAAISGAKRMLAPVLASSLTTIAAFLPLMMVGGIIGNILVAIPVVIVTIIIASLIESFLILPGHLRQSFTLSGVTAVRSLRERLDRWFDNFRDNFFRRIVELSLKHRMTTIAFAVSALLLALGLVAGGKVKYDFFPSPETQILHANAVFVAGTPEHVVSGFLRTALDELKAASEELGEGLVELAVVQHGTINNDAMDIPRIGDHVGSIRVSLAPPDMRRARNEDIIEKWRSRIDIPVGLESFTISSRRGGPPGSDIEVRLSGTEPQDIKQAGRELIGILTDIDGVSDPVDDMPYGREQLVYHLTTAGEALGLTSADIGFQLRSAFAGKLVQRFQDGADEVKVYVKLPKSERERFDVLDRINVTVPGGHQVPLMSVVNLSYKQGFETLKQKDGQLSLTVNANIDISRANAREINMELKTNVLPTLAKKYNIGFQFEGRAKDSAETMRDLKIGLVVALLSIYIILAWVFNSYLLPVVVMIAIPFGLTGAIIGHWLLGINLTVLSLFGIFGLSGIVINDSIILLRLYKEQEREESIDQALVKATSMRLRAILLTSLTTIAGLIPLIFETSLQAQFLIPMAVSISFGLGYGTILILFVIPSVLSILGEIRARVTTFKSKRFEASSA